MSRILRQAREHRGISLQEVERLTRIPLQELQLLEGGADQRGVADPTALLPSLRRYAAFLNLNPALAVSQFTAEVQEGQTAEEQAGSSERLPPVFPFSSQPYRMLPGALSLLLALGILAFLGYCSGTVRWPQSTKDAMSSPAATVPQAESRANAAPQGESPSVHSLPQPQPPAGRAPHRLRVQAKDEVWLRVTVDGQRPKDLFLHLGQVVEWSADRGFMLTLGNAGGIELALDGQVLPPLGKAGQVVRNVQLPPAAGGREAETSANLHR
jgi:cytoskeleton protein RodZ